MKRSAFKVLCMVLIIALLAPNVFAATPTPEAPLADAATVARVKQEIAAGEITDMEDLFLVAYQHLGADLEEEGMTAYINEDGTLGFTQVISRSRSRSGGDDVVRYAVTSILLVDEDGNQVTDYNNIQRTVPDPDYGYGGLDAVSVYAAQTAYYEESFIDGYVHIRMDYMVTTLDYGHEHYRAERLVQTYEYEEEYGAGPVDTKRRTVNSPEEDASYTFDPLAGWYVDGRGNGRLYSRATVYIENMNLQFSVQTVNSLHLDTD